MLQNRKYMSGGLLFALVLVAAACNSFNQSVPSSTAVPMQPSQGQASPSPTGTSTLLPTAMQTLTPEPIASSTPLVPTATLDSLSATMIAMAGSTGMLMNVSQYFNPVGIPLPTWQGIPIMPQATAGQEFSAGVYSYTAAATLDQADQFYKSMAETLGLTASPSQGVSGGPHSITLFSYELTITLTSYDNDTGHVIVVIAKMP